MWKEKKVGRWKDRKESGIMRRCKGGKVEGRNVGMRKGGKVEGRRQKNINFARWKNGKVERLKWKGE